MLPNEEFETINYMVNFAIISSCFREPPFKMFGADQSTPVTGGDAV